MDNERGKFVKPSFHLGLGLFLPSGGASLSSGSANAVTVTSKTFNTWRVSSAGMAPPASSRFRFLSFDRKASDSPHRKSQTRRRRSDNGRRRAQARLGARPRRRLGSHWGLYGLPSAACCIWACRSTMVSAQYSIESPVRNPVFYCRAQGNAADRSPNRRHGDSSSEKIRCCQRRYHRPSAKSTKPAELELASACATVGTW